ncbi:hypothetical protein ACSQ67_001616 [Phaseolus vulgaris]
MVKAYLRYEPAASFGVIASVDSNIAYDSSGKHLLSPALEKIGVWHVRQGLCSKTLTPSTASPGPSLAVTSIASSSSSLIAGGYGDGSIRIWDSDKGTCETTLNGHKGAVTALRYNKAGSLLASGSKDNDVILWDVVGETGLFRLRGHRDQHCMQIVGGHHSEIWSLDVDLDERYLVTGSADNELRFYVIRHESVDGESVKGGEESSIQSKWEVLRHFGEIQRQSKDRVATVQFNKSGNLLACQVAGKTVEIYRVLDDAEAKRKAKRRVHRKKEKKHSKEVSEVVENGDGNNVNKGDNSSVTHAVTETTNPSVTVPDVFKLLHTIRANKKICSISFCPTTPKNSLASLALSLNNNLLEVYSIELGESKKHLLLIFRGIVLILILPTNKYGVVGTKDGTIEIIDIGSGTCVEVMEAHGGSVRSITALPHKNGFVTGSANHDVKFWEYQFKQKPGQATKQLVVSNVSTMKMNDDALVVAISPDAKYIAVALLDSTVKVHFADTFKFFLSLYGHKLPVLCMDISSDGDLIVTGSADKNLKIWGLDFGDCHKSIFAHADSVMAVQFVPRTHYVFSVGKDRLVKYWDADKFELLLTLEGHHADIWCLAVSNRGDFIVTGSHDRSIRRWDRSEEQFFIEEEKEKRLEEMFEADIDNAFENKHASKEEIPEEGAVALAGKQTQETLTATDLIIERLDIAEAEDKRIAEHQEEKNNKNVAVFQSNPLMNGLSPSDYVLSAFSNVHSNDLEQTLLALPFSDALKLLSYLKDWTSYSDKVELVCRIGTLLLQTHYNQLLATPAARPILTVFSDIFYERVKGWKDIFGFNLAAMDHIQQLMASRSDALFHDAKSKLLEIRARQSKRLEERSQTGEVKRKKKKT